MTTQSLPSFRAEGAEGVGGGGAGPDKACDAELLALIELGVLAFVGSDGSADFWACDWDWDCMGGYKAFCVWLAEGLLPVYGATFV